MTAIEADVVWRRLPKIAQRADFPGWLNRLRSQLPF